MHVVSFIRQSRHSYGNDRFGYHLYINGFSRSPSAIRQMNGLPANFIDIQFRQHLRGGLRIDNASIYIGDSHDGTGQIR